LLDFFTVSQFKDTLFKCISKKEFFMQVAKWGNSLAVRLPVALVQELGIADGDELLLQPAPRQAAQPASVIVTRLPGKLERLQAVRHLRAPWGADFAFDRDEANAR
jgi:antitoxin MazE